MLDRLKAGLRTENFQSDTAQESQSTASKSPGTWIPLRTKPLWIAFDAVGTLIQPVPSVSAVYAAAAKQWGSRLTRDEVSRRFRKAFQRRSSGTGKSGGPEFADTTDESRERLWWKQLVSEVIDDVADSQTCFESLWSHFASPLNWRAFDDVRATLGQLHTLGVRLAIASNFDGRLHRLCDEMPELSCLERRIISSEIGFRKPSAGFYQSMLNRLECEPSDVWMVGDDQQNDVEAAESCGICGLWLDRSGEASALSLTTKLRVPPLKTLGEIAERLQ